MTEFVRRSEAAPSHGTLRTNRETIGARDAKVSAHLGQPFIPWQRDAADVFGEIDPATGFPWYQEWCLLVQRQAGKTTLVRARLTRRCITTPHARVRYTAQTQGDAEERLKKDFWQPISESPFGALLNQRVGRRSQQIGYDASTGKETIEFANGSSWGTAAGKSTSGHGPTLDDGVIDEAFAHKDGSIESAMRPAMLNKPQAQLGVASAAGDADSVYLHQKIIALRAMVELENELPVHERRSRVAFIEYGAPIDADPDDPETYWQHHPSVGWLTSIERILGARQGHILAGEPEEADRAYLSWWPARKAPDPVIPIAAWNDAGANSDEVDWSGAPMWSIDVSPDRDRTSIGLAGEIDQEHVWLEVPASEYGTGWAVRHLEKLRGEFGGHQVVIDGAGGAGALEQPLKDAGFEVIRLSVREVHDACQAMYDELLQQLVRHGSDPVLNSAMLSAVKRKTDGGFHWVRGRSLADITPFYAVTLAKHAFRTRRVRRYDPLESVLDPDLFDEEEA